MIWWRQFKRVHFRSRQNMQHIMLRKDMIEVVQKGEFHIYAIDLIDQALEILMARPVGKLDKKGRYSKGSIYDMVMAQLEYWQAIEDGAEIEEEEPKKKKKAKKEKKAKKKDQPAEAAIETIPVEDARNQTGS